MVNPDPNFEPNIEQLSDLNAYPGAQLTEMDCTWLHFRLMHVLSDLEGQGGGKLCTKLAQQAENGTLRMLQATISSNLM